MIRVDRSISAPALFSQKEIGFAKKRVHDFYSLPENQRIQLRFPAPFEKAERGMGDLLFDFFYGKCAYCESPIDYYKPLHIDRFRPKSGARGLDDEFSPDHYWWLMYEWSNLYLVCQTCSRYKSTWFPVDGERAAAETSYADVLQQENPWLIDPCHDAPDEHLLFLENGEVKYLTNKGRITIDILKLNRYELVQARRRVVSEFHEIGPQQPFEMLLNSWVEIVTGKGYSFDRGAGPYLACRRQCIANHVRDHPDNANRVFDRLAHEPKLVELFQQLISKDKDRRPYTVEESAVERTREAGLRKHVFLEKIVLQNYKCFSSLTIRFEDTAMSSAVSSPIDVNQEPWLLFLGENGVGKSSILKAIAIALMGNAYRKQLEEEITPDRLLKRGTEEGYIQLFLKGEQKPVEVHFAKGAHDIECSHPKPVSNLLGYGAVRLLPNKNIQPEAGSFGGVKAGNLFDYSVALSDAKAWLLLLDEAAFDRAALSLKDLLLLGDTDKLERDIEHEQVNVIVQNNLPVAIEELSDGYKAVFALVGDIMSTLANENVTYDLAEGIVLVDEIGTHLHPRWKMEVVSRLRKCFPRIQFIVTTHEPLCLRGLQASEAVVLTRNTDKEVVAITDLPDPAGLRVDQILTSEFFGLKSAIDPMTEALFEEYYAILALDEPERTEEQKNRLLQLNTIIPRIKHLGDNQREELVYFVIDELLAKKMKKGGIQIREELKQQAIDRVKNLWQMISPGTNDKI